MIIIIPIKEIRPAILLQQPSKKVSTIVEEVEAEIRRLSSGDFGSREKNPPVIVGDRLMRIKLRSYEPSSTMLSCSRLISSVRIKKLISNRVKQRKRLRYLKKQKKKHIYEDIAGLLSVRGPIPLPTQHRKYCLLKSPHVNKTSRDHYEINIHKRLLYVEFCNKNILNFLRDIDILPGIQVDIVYD